jgi:hypothetical protein
MGWTVERLEDEMSAKEYIDLDARARMLAERLAAEKGGAPSQP